MHSPTMHMELVLESIYLIRPIDGVEEKSAVRASKAQALFHPRLHKKKTGIPSTGVWITGALDVEAKTPH